MRCFPIRFLGPVLAAALLLGACAPDEDDDEAEPAPEDPQPGEQVEIEGTLAGDAQLEGGCAWVEADGEQYEVTWPEGYDIEFEPLRLVRDGEEVATEGDVVTVTGEVSDAMMSICQVGPILDAHEVEVGQS